MISNEEVANLKFMLGNADLKVASPDLVFEISEDIKMSEVY